jgi:drug/metabolite transporter (DMT)-like permease
LSISLTPVLIALSILIGVIGQFLLKAGMDAAGRVESSSQLLSLDFLVSAFSQWQVPVALVMYATGAMLWMAVLSREKVSYAFPFLGISYVLVMLGGWVLFGERPNASGLAGTVLVAVGVALVARS